MADAIAMTEDAFLRTRRAVRAFESDRVSASSARHVYSPTRVKVLSGPVGNYYRANVGTTSDAVTYVYNSAVVYTRAMNGEYLLAGDNYRADLVGYAADGTPILEAIVTCCPGPVASSGSGSGGGGAGWYCMTPPASGPGSGGTGGGTPTVTCTSQGGTTVKATIADQGGTTGLGGTYTLGRIGTAESWTYAGTACGGNTLTINLLCNNGYYLASIICGALSQTNTEPQCWASSGTTSPFTLAFPPFAFGPGCPCLPNAVVTIAISP